jgi:hypothetical protein
MHSKDRARIYEIFYRASVSGILWGDPRSERR